MTNGPIGQTPVHNDAYAGGGLGGGLFAVARVAVILALWVVGFVAFLVAPLIVLFVAWIVGVTWIAARHRGKQNARGASAPQAPGTYRFAAHADREIETDVA